MLADALAGAVDVVALEMAYFADTPRCTVALSARRQATGRRSQKSVTVIGLGTEIRLSARPCAERQMTTGIAGARPAQGTRAA